MATNLMIIVITGLSEALAPGTVGHAEGKQTKVYITGGIS